MKSLGSFLLLLGVLGALVLGTACERHPASQTISGYDAQKAAQEEAAQKQIELPSGAPVKFFHQEGTSNQAPMPAPEE